jgi:hypothetical protein
MEVNSGGRGRTINGSGRGERAKVWDLMQVPVDRSPHTRGAFGSRCRSVDKRGNPAQSLYCVHAGMVMFETGNLEGWKLLQAKAGRSCPVDGTIWYSILGCDVMGWTRDR